jgi:hypothetical protein
MQPRVVVLPGFFRSLFSLWLFAPGKINPHRLKRVPLSPEIIPLPILNQLLDGLAVFKLFV